MSFYTKLWQRLQQSLCVWMCRLFEDFARRAVFDDLSGVHYAHPIRYVGNNAKIVCDVDDRHFELFLKLLNQSKDLRLYCNIKRSGRFIANQNFGPAGDCCSDDNALAHSARKLVGVLLIAGFSICYANAL